MIAGFRWSSILAHTEGGPTFTQIAHDHVCTLSVCECTFHFWVCPHALLPSSDSKIMSEQKPNEILKLMTLSF